MLESQSSKLSLQSRGISILRYSEETKYLKQNWAKANYPVHQQEQEDELSNTKRFRAEFLHCNSKIPQKVTEKL